MYDKLIHKWFKIPYMLHTRTFRRVGRPKATVLFLHGIGNNGSAWQEIASRLPSDINCAAVDLLGFGESAKPEWAIYDARRQARSVLATYFRLQKSGKVIIVGHSLGALVAIEIAKRYPALVDNLILCAPPLYRADDGMRLPRHPDAVLRRIYTQAERYPDQFFALAEFATRYRLVNKTFSVTKESLHSYIGSLRAMILNQTSLDDVLQIKMPTHIIYGSLDPLVISQNIKKAGKANANITIERVIAGHEIRGSFVGSIIRAIRHVVD
ncbi:MAG TPA: alpha/beta hydrolase [Candidatus Saccharimonadales bacterium]